MKKNILTGRNTYLTRKAFRVYLTASILTALSAMLGTTVDGVIVSQLINADGLSAITLSRPIVQFYYTIYLLFGSGTGMLVAYELGKNNKERAEGFYTMVWSCLGVLFGIFTLLGFVAPMAVVRLMCGEESMQPLVAQYLQPYLVGSFSFMLNYLMGAYCALSGNPRRVSMAVIINNVINLSLDLLFIMVFNMGLAGSAWATVIGNTVGVIIMGQYLLGKKASFHVNFEALKKLKAQLGSMLGQMLKKGAPFALASVCMVFFLYSSNTILLLNYGAEGIFVLSVIMNILTLYNLFLTGSCTALQSLGALQVGEGDYSGLKISVKYAFRVMLTLSVITMVVLLIYPELTAMLFKCPEEYLEECNLATRLNCISFLVFSVDYLLLVNYQLLSRSSMATFISLTLSPSVIPFMLLFAHVAPEMIWWSNLLGYLMVFVIIVIWGECIRRKDQSLAHITLLPSEAKLPTYEVSLNYESIPVAEELQRLYEWLQKEPLSDSLRFKTNLIAEELMTNIARFNNKKSEKSTFDVHIILHPDHVMFYTHDDGTPFNPLECRDEGLGLKIVKGLSQVTYKYQFGQNMTTAKITNDDQEK